MQGYVRLEGESLKAHKRRVTALLKKERHSAALLKARRERANAKRREARMVVANA